jgi:F-type H+-transporting ATPase subunit epsilon
MTNKTGLNDTLKVSIKTKDKTLFTGVVSTVSSKNEDGVFDVLPLHTNFITLVFEYIILDKGLAAEKKFDIDKGILYVLSNRVDIYVGI